MDEPTNGELARGIADIKGMVAVLVSRAEYTAWQQGLEYRFAELARLAESERIAREVGDRDLNARLNEQTATGTANRMSWRSAVWTGALPALACILAAVLTYLITRGGH